MRYVLSALSRLIQEGLKGIILDVLSSPLACLLLLLTLHLAGAIAALVLKPAFALGLKVRVCLGKASSALVAYFI